jgi:hypothetical protein
MSRKIRSASNSIIKGINSLSIPDLEPQEMMIEEKPKKKNFKEHINEPIIEEEIKKKNIPQKKSFVRIVPVKETIIEEEEE